MSNLALCGGAPTIRDAWPTWPIWDERERRALSQALEEGEWGGFPMPNRHAGRFAEAFARRHDVRHALCVANGTVALEVAIQAAGIEPGAEVIVPAYTFEATAAAVLFAGCVPVFADIDPATYCLDPASAESRIGPRTQALLPVHLGMGMAHVAALRQIADDRGLRLIEDCAHAHGSRFDGRAAGSWGDAGAFSFQTSKLLSCGEGGIVTTQSDEVLDHAFALVNSGRQRPSRSADAVVVGHNYRLSDLQAAVLEIQLERLDGQHEIRNRNARSLTKKFSRVAGIEPLARPSGVTEVAIYQYVLRYDSEAFEGLPRAAFAAALGAEGVPCDGRFYECLTESPLLPRDPRRYPAFAARGQAPCPVAEKAAREEALWIPHQVLLADETRLDGVVDAIEKIRAHAGNLHDLEHPAIEEQRVFRIRR